jgi:hypothetical protein
VELARLMGVDVQYAGGGPVTFPRGPYYEPLPYYSSSLDALFGAGGPVEYAIERGWLPELSRHKRNFWRVTVGHPMFDAVDVDGDSPAAALATAIYEALKESPHD